MYGYPNTFIVELRQRCIKIWLNDHFALVDAGNAWGSVLCYKWQEASHGFTRLGNDDFLAAHHTFKQLGKMGLGLVNIEHGHISPQKTL
jgi:hypothetical protein